MNQNHILPVIEGLYKDSATPVFCCGSQWKVVWRNTAFMHFFPNIAIGQDMRTAFPATSSAWENAETADKCRDISLAPTQAAGEFKRLFLFPLCTKDICYYLCYLHQEQEKTDNLPAPSCAVMPERCLTSISGQYRSPLFRIFNLLDPIARTLEAQEQYETVRYVKQIAQYSYKMMKATINLTEYGKLSFHTENFQFRRVNLNLLFQDICHSVQILLRNTELEFHYHITAEPLISMIDEEKFLLAFMNLISNSCAYSSPGNEVTVTLEKQRANFVLTVSDHGVGIPSEHLPHIFEPFFSHDPNGSLYSGLGLGLPIVKLVAQAHKGNVYLSSEENKGTVVTLKIPLQNDPQANGVLKSNSANYIANKFSPLYVFLADVCDISGIL